MSFTNRELEILDVAYQTFLPKEYALRLFSEKNPNAGYEAWAIHELILGFLIRGMQARKHQKPDLKVDGIGIQFKAGADPSGWSWQAKDFKKHPETELHLFVAAYNEDSWKKMEDFLNINNIIFEARDLGRSGWKVILAKA